MGFVIRSHYPAWVNNVSGQLNDIIMWLKKKQKCTMHLLWFAYLYPIPELQFYFSKHTTWWKQHHTSEKWPVTSFHTQRERERGGTFLNLKLSWTRCPAAAWLRTILKLSNCIHNGGVYILLYFWFSKKAYKSSNKKIYSLITIHQCKVQSQLYFLTCFPA